MEKKQVISDFALQHTEDQDAGETKIEEKEGIERKVFLCEGVYTLADFYELWIKNKNLAKRIFYYKEFEMWLLKLKYPFMNFFEVFLKDLNKERGMNNFFLFNGFSEEIKLNIELDEENKELILTKTGEGFIEKPIYTKAPWIILNKSHITNKDFDSNGTAKITYSIDSKRARKTEHSNIYIGGQFVELSHIEKEFIEIELLNNYKNIDEEIEIKITNNKNVPLYVEFEAKEMIKFESTKYTIGKEPIIVRCKIKLSALQLARKTLGKIIIFEENIRVYSRFENRRFYKDIPITVGDLYGG